MGLFNLIVSPSTNRQNVRNFGPIFEQDASIDFGPIFEKSVNFGPIKKEGKECII